MQTKQRKIFSCINKYASIIHAAIITIASSLQVIYASSIPQLILPVVSAGAIVAVAFQALPVHKKYGSIQEQHNSNCRQKNFYSINMKKNIPYSRRRNDQDIFKRMMKIWKEGHGKWKETVEGDSENLYSYHIFMIQQYKQYEHKIWQRLQT